VKRLLLLGLVLAALVPGTADAKAPCRDRIYNDWYADGKIATTYPLSCYRDALKNVPTDARVYSSLLEDIRAAMQGAQSRLRGHTVPAQVGKSGGKSRPTVTTTEKPTKTTPTKTVKEPDSVEPVSETVTPPQTTTLAASQTGGGSGVPVPLLVLGALALLLAAVGAAGVVAKRAKR
jgi:hypothetical protein